VAPSRSCLLRRLAVRAVGDCGTVSETNSGRTSLQPVEQLTVSSSTHWKGGWWVLLVACAGASAAAGWEFPIGASSVVFRVVWRPRPAGRDGSTGKLP
jgi:hypothetical protein